MLYSYRVRDRLGNITEGYLEADHHQTVIDYLLQSKFYILNLHEERTAEKLLTLSGKLLGRDKMNMRDLSLFMRQLATMIGAGIPIIEAFRIMAGQHRHRRLKKLAAQIQAGLQRGLALHEAMALYPLFFSPVYTNMIRSGEIGGVLPAVLQQIAEQLEREKQLNDKIKSASAYPAIIAMVACLVIVFVLTFILPSFVQVFASTATELPPFTAKILTLGLFIKNKYIFLLLLTAGILGWHSLWGKTKQGRLSLDGLYLKLPLAGNLIKKIEAAKFTRLLGMLIKSGIPLLTAMQTLEGTIGNQVVRAAVSDAREKIKEGQSIAGPLNETGLFEPMITQLIAIGEETGTLHDMLERTAVFYETEVNHAVDSLVSILEPLLIIIVSLVIGMIIIAIYLPIFNLVTTVGI